MSVKERLICFIRHLNLSQNKFEKICELSNGYINNIRVSIQPKTLDKIIAHYPGLNIEWLITGQGEMIKNDLSVVSPLIDDDKLRIIKMQEKIIQMYEEKIRLLETDIIKYEKELRDIEKKKREKTA